MSEIKYAGNIDGYVTDDTIQNPAYPNIPETALPPPRKSRTITFRVTNKLHETLERWAEQHDVSMSGLVAVIVEEYWKAQNEIYEKARYFNACDKETREEILRHEKNYPRAYRQFTIASHLYPSTERSEVPDAGVNE